ncbi:MAG: TolC family protein, partial [Sphingomonas sp.]
MQRLIAALLAVASCASIAQAQSSEPISTGPTLTLDQALALAGATAPTLDAATAGVRAAEAGRTVAGYRPNPSIVAETENVAGSGQYRGVRSAETTAGLAFPIELGGKRSARIAVADALGSRARIGSALAEADLRLAVTQLYIEATAADRRLVTARQQAGIAREALRAAGVRVQAGRASPLEQQRADVLRINAETAV